MSNTSSVGGPSRPLGVIMLLGGLVLLVASSVYAYQTAEQRDRDCRVDEMVRALAGIGQRDCETGVPIGAWFAIGAAILLAIAGLVVVALAPSKMTAQSRAETPPGLEESSEGTEDRLVTLKRLLDEDQITADEFKSRRDTILENLYRN